jgi:hypothetical protein
MFLVGKSLKRKNRQPTSTIHCYPRDVAIVSDSIRGEGVGHVLHLLHVQDGGWRRYEAATTTNSGWRDCYSACIVLTDM